MAWFRGAFFVAYMAIITVVMGAICLPALAFGYQAASACIRAWSRLMLGSLRVICGVRLNLQGQGHIPQGAAIVAANHHSMWETIALYALLPKATLVFKEELLRIPVYGWWGIKAGNIVIDRNAGAKSYRKMSREVKSRLDDGRQVVIFPEGTRAPADQVLPFQPGIAGLYGQANVYCTPTVHNSGDHWLHPGPAKTPGTITLRFLPALEPGLQKRVFLERLEGTMRANHKTLGDDGEEVFEIGQALV
ncbi:MAG: lysophospholipid acyltransferase family protein [Pseudomonadota bacterium]